MSAQPVKKTGVGNASAPLDTVKPAGVATIAPDSDQRMRYWCGEVDDFINELSKLRCLSGLLAGQQSVGQRLDRFV